MYNDQEKFILEMQDWFNILVSMVAIHHFNRLKKKKHMNSSKYVKHYLLKFDRILDKKKKSH